MQETATPATQKAVPQQEAEAHTASCQCGATGYQLRGEPLTCYTCHCTDCQSESGGACTISMIVDRDAVEVTRGEVAVNHYEHKGEAMNRHHCAACGSALWFTADSFPAFRALKAGAFEDHSWYQPVAHLWLRSAQPWLALSGSGVQYQTQPEMGELFSLWTDQQAEA